MSLPTCYNTDKALHGYNIKYQELFDHKKNEPIRLLEIGIGSKELPSLRMWADYFPNGTIVGFDLEPSYVFSPIGYDRIETYVCSSFNKKQIDALHLEPFDIIIDDGCHRCDGQQITFCNLFHNYLKKGGLYVIEDCDSSLIMMSRHFGKDMQKDKLTIGPPFARIETDIPKFCIENQLLVTNNTTYSLFTEFMATGILKNFYLEQYLTEEERQEIESEIKHVEWWWQGSFIQQSRDILCIVYK